MLGKQTASLGTKNASSAGKTAFAQSTRGKVLAAALAGAAIFAPAAASVAAPQSIEAQQQRTDRLYFQEWADALARRMTDPNHENHRIVMDEVEKRLAASTVYPTLPQQDRGNYYNDLVRQTMIDFAHFQLNGIENARGVQLSRFIRFEGNRLLIDITGVRVLTGQQSQQQDDTIIGG
jgi:hypothetical protein